MSPGLLWGGLDLAGTGVALVAMVGLHLVPTGLSPLNDPVSRYGITPARAGYRVLTVAMGVAGLAAAVGVAAVATMTQHMGVLVALVIFGVCRLAISWAPMDAPGRPPTTRGLVHVALALGAFAAAAVAAHKLAAGMQRPEMIMAGASFRVAFWLIVLGLAGQLILRRARGDHRYYGAAERVVYLGIFTMLATAGLRLL